MEDVILALALKYNGGFDNILTAIQLDETVTINIGRSCRVFACSCLGEEKDRNSIIFYIRIIFF